MDPRIIFRQGTAPEKLDTCLHPSGSSTHRGFRGAVLKRSLDRIELCNPLEGLSGCRCACRLVQTYKVAASVSPVWRGAAPVFRSLLAENMTVRETPYPTILRNLPRCPCHINRHGRAIATR